MLNWLALLVRLTMPLVRLMARTLSRIRKLPLPRLMRGSRGIRGGLVRLGDLATLSRPRTWPGTPARTRTVRRGDGRAAPALTLKCLTIHATDGTLPAQRIWP